MLLKDMPIRKKITRIILLISGIGLTLTSAAFLIYEYYTFKEATLQKLSTLGSVIASNSTAALAFDSPKDATDILSALKAAPHIVVAGLYDKGDHIFSRYPADVDSSLFPLSPGNEGFDFKDGFIEGFTPVLLGDKRLGVLYLKSDLEEMYSRLRVYAIVVGIVILLSFFLIYLMSKALQRSISKPILSLANTARLIAEQQDYSVRATKSSNDEIGLFTDAFNTMLEQISLQNRELADFNQHLEQKIQDRTLELRAVNKELESFSYSVSHDLRAPLRAMNGYARMLAKNYEANLDEEANRIINNIISAAKKMGQLIDDLLTFSRLGRKEIVKTDISMNVLVNEVWNELNTPESKRDTKLELKILPDAFADSGTIKQVWANLLSNAMKYSKLKEKTIIEVGSKDGGNEVIYYVKDNGAGFDMRFADKLFGVFQRLHSEKEFDGTGVGLAIVQRIISRHGGRVWAEAVLDEGATFYFSLVKNQVE